MDKSTKPGSDWLLSVKNFGIDKPVSYTTALDLLKSWCVDVGIKKDVGFHSLQRDSATFMHSLDIDLVYLEGR